MLVQIRGDSTGLIEQHAHSVMAGHLAQAWVGLDGQSPLPFGVVWATAMHDLPWRAADRVPAFNPDTGAPYGFQDYPEADRLAIYREGLDDLEAIDPWLGLVVSHHYTTFKGMDRHEAFQAKEAARRARLADRLGYESPEADEVVDAVRWLKFFDLLSLTICLSPPFALPRSRPRWMTAENAGRLPTGERLGLRWSDAASQLELSPFPLRAPTTLTIPMRVYPGRELGSAEALDAALEEATETIWTVLVHGPLEAES